MLRRVTLATTATPFVAPWFKRYMPLLQAALRQEGVDLVVASPLDVLVNPLPSSAPVLLQTPWDLPAWMGRGHRLFCHIHGSPAAAFGNWSRRDWEVEAAVASACETLFCNSHWSSDCLIGVYDDVNTAVTGLPLAMPARPFSKDAGYILVPGRMGFTRLPWILMEALAPLGKKVIFSTPYDEQEFESSTKDGYLAHPAFADVEVRNEVTGGDWYRLLAGADTVVIGSTFDTLNVSLCEAVLWGIPVVAPDCPLFRELGVANLYEPHSIRSIRAATKDARRTDAEHVERLTSPTQVAKAYTQVFFGRRR